MRAAGNNSLLQQPRSGGCLTLRRQGGQQAPDRASWQSGAQDFRGPLLFPPPSTSTSGLSPPSCRGLIAATPWLVALFPPPLAGPVPTASQPHTTPCLSAFQPLPMQFLPYLSHKIQFQKSLFPTPPRPPAPRPPPPGCASSCLWCASRGCVLHLPPWAQAGTWTDGLDAGSREGANREGRFHNWEGERKEETQGSLTWS